MSAKDVRFHDSARARIVKGVNAASIAGLIRTTDATVAEAPKDEKPVQSATPELEY